jgi:hypothetical protein
MTFDERKRKWWQWHRVNPHVYAEFERRAFQAVAAGREKISGWLIINRMRWETEIETQGGEFKLPNDYIAFYARLFHAHHPEHAGFITTKRMKGET